MTLLGQVIDVWSWSAFAAGVLGVLVLVVGWRGDPARGRRRCPKCWYAMAGVPGLMCPECGNTANDETRLFKRRRRWWVAAAGLALLLGAAGGYSYHTVRSGGKWSLLPISAAVHIVPWYDSAPKELVDRIMTRLNAGPIRQWQRNHLYWRARTSLKNTTSAAEPRLLALDLIEGVARRGGSSSRAAWTGEATGAVPTLIVALNDPVADVRAGAIDLLRTIKGDPQQILRATVPLIDTDADARVRERAVQIVQDFADTPAANEIDIVPRLRKAYKDGDVGYTGGSGMFGSSYASPTSIGDMCVYAAEKLAPIHPEAVPWLGEVVEGGDLWACEALHRLGARAVAAAPSLARAIDTDDRLAGACAVRALAGVGDRSDATRRAMIESIRKRPGFVEAFAAFAALFRDTPGMGADLSEAVKQWPLEQIALGVDTACLAGEDAAPFVPLLESTIRAAPPGAPRLWRAYKWAFIGGGGDPALLEFVDVPTPLRGPADVWRVALRGRMTGRVAEAVEVIARELRPQTLAEESWMREAAVEALGYFGPNAAESLPLLTERLNDPSIEIRSHAKKAIERITGTKDLEPNR